MVLSLNLLIFASQNKSHMKMRAEQVLSLIKFAAKNKINRKSLIGFVVFRFGSYS